MIKKDSKEIYTRQNEAEMLDLLKAQHFTYSSAKNYAIILFLFLTFFPLVINIITTNFINNETLRSLLYFIILILFVLGLVIRYKLKKKKVLAAYIQQSFDIYVFNMKETYFQKTSITEAIIKARQKYQRINEEEFKNWYSDYSDLPYERAIFYCQKGNYNWTLKLSRKYLITLIITFIVILTIGIINSIVNHSLLSPVFLTLFTLLPIISSFVDSCQKLAKDIQVLKEILSEIEQVEKELDKIDDKKLSEITEELQAKIFLYRQKAYLIPDWFNALNKKDFQNIENEMAKETSKQYKSKLKGSSNEKIW